MYRWLCPTRPCRTLELSDGERDELQSLRNREFLIEDQGGVLLGMVDLLLATAYDHRTTQGEPTVRNHATHHCRMTQVRGYITGGNK